METKDTSNRLHPLVAGAAISVMLVSLIGVAAITGILPNSNSTVAPAASAPVPLVSKAAPVESFITEPADPKPYPASSTNLNEPQQPKVMRKPAAPTQLAQAPQSAPNYNPDYSQQRAPVQRTAQARQICHSCGRVESINAIQQQAQPSGVGVAAGAVIGGLLGNQVGSGNGRTLATVAGAVGGGYAGNEVERRNRHSTTYQVRVRMQDGSVRTFPQSGGSNGWQVGDRVRVVNGALTSEG